MFTAFQLLVSFLSRVVLSLRYRVTVEGLEEAKKKPGPYLILPSHPAYIDPPIVISHLWPAFKMRPMLLETNFESPLLAPFAWIQDAIKVPETEISSADAKQRAENSVNEVIEAMKKGDNIILWPTGTLSRTGVDYVGAARTAADVLRAVPGATVVLLRNRGLWGGRFSWGYLRTKPKLTRELVAGIKILLANLIVFAPRRKVNLHIEAFTAAERAEPTREKLNPWLEQWYNVDGGDKQTFVPYHFLFGPRTREFPPPPPEEVLDVSSVKDATREFVTQLLSEHLKRPLTAEENRSETMLSSLGLDSLESMEITLQIEQRSNFSSELVPTTIGHLWALNEGLLDKGPPKPPAADWFIPPSDSGPMTILGETIPEAFVTRALQNRKEVAVADDLAGTVTFEKLLVGASAMAARFRDLPGENVGLLLPASVAADIAFFGLHLAGKLPVLLNWTTGPANVEYAAKLTKLSRVVTSRRFIDRTQITVPGTEFVFLEDVRESMGKLELLRRLLTIRFLPKLTSYKLLGGLNLDPERPAVVLFTSGSEKAPKAVPLTHRNIIADQRGAVPPQQLTRCDSVLGFLPMFHSFGITIAALFPILAGAKLVHHPDPTDASALAKKLVAYRPKILIATPTFISFILNRCKPGDMDSLRLIVVGAEKCPDELFDRIKQISPNTTVLEGYGVTECSPCVSVNPVDAVRRGTIGKPLPNVKVCAVDLETNEPLPANQMGMLLVAGPTVFPGYLNPDAPSPFVERNGERWYVTGDLAAIDDAGYIVFHGRLKRFIKAGGEMISLPALEEPFTRHYPPTDEGPRVAVEGVETPGGRHVVLFAVDEISLKDANAILQKEGFRGVMRLDEVRRVPQIPVLGTGKTDYKVLRAQIAVK